jgi:hypothetical protein
MMLRKTAELLERLGIGHVLLHGGVPGRQRRELLDRLRRDPQCRILLSTDAGGTGLNLQAADTVINLEVPWNPAVLAQRIARVHRLGQDRSVRVINLVTRGSIEERVLKTVEVKRSLFEGLFDNESDEVSFEALGRQAFLDTVRDLVAPQEPARPAPAVDPAQTLLLAGVQFLEALAGVLSRVEPGKPVLQIPLPPPEVLERGATAIQAILQGLARPR